MLLNEDTHPRINEQMNIDPCIVLKYIADDNVMNDVAWQLWQDLYSIRRNEMFLGILQARNINLEPML